MQRRFRLGAPAMLRFGIQVPKLGFELHIFFQHGAQRAAHVAVGSRQYLVNRSVVRVTFHWGLTAN